MGVTHLWQILEPVKQHVPLQSLKGKTLAVDLSLWVCEAQTVKKMVGIVTKPHLRNLFFRVSSLTLMGIHLIFVMEGEPPKLKATTLQNRIDARFGPSEKPRSRRIKRSHFKCLLKECLEMLDCLGVPWVQAAGEAEATCAYLNANGYVDGCITNDGDAFLYGAQTVYRNFTMNAKDPHVDCYTMSAIEEKLGCSRESLIGLAILLGCDYLPKGVPGVGKEQAVKLIRTLRGQSLLQRFEHWKEHVQYGNTSAVPVQEMPHCPVCHHPGDYKDHGHFGCHLCGSLGSCKPHDVGSLCPCKWHSSEQDWQTSTAEENIRKKTEACEGFPFPEVIQEYLIIKDKPMKLNEYQRPNLLSFQRFASKKMDWTKQYACEKLCVLLAYYDMNRRKSGYISPQQLQALRIVKTRVKNGIPCFEIEWKKPDDYAAADDQPGEPFLITIEESSLFQAAYPEIVALYQMGRLESRKEKKKGKRNKLKEPECFVKDSEVADLFSRLNIQSAVETISSKDSKPSVLTVPSFQILTKDATTQDLPVTADVSAAAKQRFSPPSTSFTTDLQKAECEFSPLGFLSSQGQFTERSTKYDAYVSNLQLSSIDWEETSFSISPLPDNVSLSSVAASVTCTNSTGWHSPLCCKIDEIILPCSDSLKDGPDSPSSVGLSASESDLNKGKYDLFLKEHGLPKPSVTKAFPKVPNMSPLNPLKTVEQVKETSQPEKPRFSPLSQLNDGTQEIGNVLLEKYPRGNCVKVLKCSEDSTQIAKDLAGDTSLSLDLNTRTLKPDFENKQLMLCLKSTKNQGKCHLRKSSVPNIPKTSFKKSVCQKSCSSEDSDSEAKKETRKGQRSPKWQRKCNMVDLKGRCRERRKNHQLAESQVLNQKGPSTDLSVNGPLVVHIHRPLEPTESETGRCCSHLQENERDSEVLVDSPLPLSERLKLRLQNS